MAVEIVTLSLEIDARNIRRRLDRVEDNLRRIGNAGDREARKVEGSFEKLSRRATTLGQNLRAAFSLFLTAELSRRAFNIAREIELNFSRIEGLVGLSGAELEGFKDGLGAIATETGKTGVELSRALFTITSAGARGAQALKVLELSAKAAAAGLGDTEVVAKALLGAVQSYGEANLSAAESLDVLVATVRAGNLSADQLAVTLGKVTGVGAELGIEFSDLGGFIANISLTGLSAAESVSRLSGVLRFLQRTTPETEKKLKSIGTSGEELRMIAGSGPRGLVTVFEFLRQKLVENNKTFAEIVPEVEALQGILSLVGRNVTSTARVFDTVTNSAGSAEEAFGAYSKTAQAAADRATANFSKALANIGNAILPDVTFAINKLTDTINILNQAFLDRRLDKKTPLEQINESISEQSEKLTAAQNRLNSATSGIRGGLDRWVSSLIPATDATAQYRKEVEEAEAELRRLQKRQLQILNAATFRRQSQEFLVELNKFRAELDEALPQPRNVFEDFFGGGFFDFGDQFFAQSAKAAQGAQLVETEAERLIASLERERDLYGDVTKEQEIRYKLEKEGIDGLTPAREELIRSLAKEITERDKLKLAQEENIRKTKQIRNAIGEFETDELERQLDREKRARELLQMTFSEQNKEALAAAQQIEEFNQLAKQVDFISDEDVQRFADFVNSQLSFMNNNAEETFNQIDEFSRAAFESMQNTASDLFFGVMQGEFDDLAGNFKKTLDRMVADLLASQLLNAVITRGGGDVQTGGTGFSFGTFLSSFGIGQGARGAFAQKNQPFLIGERGPELFVPQTAGNIVPLKGPAEVNAGGGPSNDMFNTGTQSVMVNMTIQTPDAASFQRSQSQIAANAAQTFNAALRRNG